MVETTAPFHNRRIATLRRFGRLSRVLWGVLIVRFVGVLALRAVPSPELDPPRANRIAPFDLRITATEPGVTLRFTRDGSMPTAEHGETYATPIRIATPTVIRAAAIRDKAVSAVVTGTFLLPSGVAQQTGAGCPPIWGTYEGHPMTAHYGVNVRPDLRGQTAEAFATALRSLPSISLVLPPESLWDSRRGIYLNPQETGEEWERAGSFEFLPSDGDKAVQLDCGIRIQGGWSRRPEESPKHSLRLIFRKRYGASRLRYPVFGEPADDFTTLILRGGNNNSWLHPDAVERGRAEYLRDSWMRETSAALGHPAARGRFVHLYLNGLYWGLYQITERPDGHFAAKALGGAASDFDARNADKIISGDDVAWKQLFAAANADIHSDANYQRIGALLDLPSFIDFILLNLYGANADWDRSSNWYAARKRTPAGPYHFFEWDGERTLEAIADNRLTTDDDESPMRLFHRLREHPAFVRAFAARARVVLGEGGPLSPAQAAARYRRMADALEPAISAEAARWGSYRKKVAPFRTGPYEIYTRETHWRPEVNRLLQDYFPARTGEVLRQWTAAGLLPQP